MIDFRKLDPARANRDHEKSRIRWVNLADPEEKKRLWEIETNSLVVRYVEDLFETEDELIEFTALEKDYLVLAVEGKSGHVEETEVGKLQGWITVYPEDKRRLARLQRQGLINPIKKDLRILEIGFAKHPTAKPGQIASAIRQALALLSEAHKQDGARTLVVTAYADEANEASTRVLLAAGFSLRGKVKYHLKNISHDNFFILFG